MIVLIVLSLKVPRENLRMSRRALVNCGRCSDPIRKDKMVERLGLGKLYWVCKHCDAVIIREDKKRLGL